MSLSDTCYETLSTLGEDIQFYVDWHYNDFDLSGIVDAMFELAEVGASLDAITPFHGDKRSLTVSKVVVLALLTNRRKSNNEIGPELISVLADIACINYRLSDALLKLEALLATDAGEDILHNEFPQLAYVAEILHLVRRSGRLLAA